HPAVRMQMVVMDDNDHERGIVLTEEQKRGCRLVAVVCVVLCSTLGVLPVLGESAAPGTRFMRPRWMLACDCSPAGTFVRPQPAAPCAQLLPGRCRRATASQKATCSYQFRARAPGLDGFDAAPRGLVGVQA